MDILFDLLLSGTFDVVLEVLSRVFRGAARRRPHVVFGGIGALALGCAAGGLVTWLLPTRLLGAPALPGASVIVSPLLNGVLMHYYGSWQAKRQIQPSFAATFWGGALFAFGFSVVRFLMLD